MDGDFKKFFKTIEETKDDIITNFANDFFNEVQKLVERYGKEDFMRMLKTKD